VGIRPPPGWFASGNVDLIDVNLAVVGFANRVTTLRYNLRAGEHQFVRWNKKITIGPLHVDSTVTIFEFE
jgi:hypothetical protein